jgi:hypothetical protein
VFVPDINDQTDDSDDQAAKRRDLVRSQAEVDGAGAAAVLRGGCYFDDFDAHGLFIRRQRLVALGQPLQVLLVVGVGGVEGDEGVVCDAFDALCCAHDCVGEKLVHD